MEVPAPAGHPVPAPSGEAPLRAIFLDAGGTLIHLDRTFLREVLAARGVRAGDGLLDGAFHAARTRAAEIASRAPATTDAERAHLLWETVLRFAGCPQDALVDACGEVDARARAGRLWTHVEPGTREVLGALREMGAAVGVVSNSDGRVAEYLETAGLGGLFDFVIDSGRVGVEKPDPAIFRLACGEAGIQPWEAVHIGDTFGIDVVGARAAGVEAVLLDPEDRATALGCARIADLGELPALVRPRLRRGG